MQYKEDREKIIPFHERGNSNGNVGHLTTNGGNGDHLVRVTFHRNGDASLRVSREFLDWAQSREKTRAAVEQALKE